MTAVQMCASLARMISGTAVGGSYLIAARVAADAAQKNERSRVAFSHDLPPLKGDKLSVTVVEVDYGPGESSTPHRHLCPMIGYLLEGTLRTRVKGSRRDLQSRRKLL